MKWSFYQIESKYENLSLDLFFMELKIRYSREKHCFGVWVKTLHFHVSKVQMMTIWPKCFWLTKQIQRTYAEKRTFSQWSVWTVFEKNFDARRIQNACCWWTLRKVEVQLFLHSVHICTSNSHNVLRQRAYCILCASKFFLNTVHNDRCDEALFLAYVLNICSLQRIFEL